MGRTPLETEHPKHRNRDNIQADIKGIFVHFKKEGIHLDLRSQERLFNPAIISCDVTGDSLTPIRGFWHASKNGLSTHLRETE